MFGPKQVGIYAGYLSRAVELLEDDPSRASSLRRPDLREGARSLHLAIAAGRRGAAAHVLYFREMKDEAGDPVVVIVRVLHEHMDPRLHLGKTPAGDTPPT